MNNEEFIYKKMQFIENGWRKYLWYLIHKETRNGVHFHGQQYDENYDYGKYRPWDDFENGRSRYRFSAHGIEVHSVKPMYENHTPIKSCDVTGGDCYCDGSSLSASRLLGHINPDGSDDVTIWNVLHDWYESNFGSSERARQALAGKDD